jgi:hypothetical protein
MSKNQIPFAVKLNASRGLQCKASGCLIGRDSISPYCGRHRLAMERYGDPHGFRLSRNRDYGIERALVQKFLTRHRAHKGVNLALEYLDSWLRNDKHAQRLAQHGVTAFEVLVEVAALHLLSHFNPRRLPAGPRLVFAAGIGVLSLAPRLRRQGFLNGKPRTMYVRLGKVARREVGTRLLTHLLPLLVSISVAIERNEATKQERGIAYRQGFAAEACNE